MSRRTILRFARPTTLQAVLDGIVARTNAKQGANLPHVTTLRPVVAGETDLPVFVDAPPDGKVGFVYCAGHSPHVPPGEPPLIVCFRPLPGHGCEEGGVFSGAIVAYAWQHPLYPLSPKEVEWSIAHDCGCESHEWSHLSECWEKLNEIADDDLQDLVAQYEAGISSPPGAPPDALPLNSAHDESNISPPENGQETGRGEEQAANKPKHKRKTDPSHRGSGQPRKPATFHLMDLMRTLPSDRLYDFKPFFPSWLHVYEEKEGRTPPFPEDLFRQAAVSCAERILIERGEN
jgi:hypothetical protein